MKTSKIERRKKKKEEKKKKKEKKRTDIRRDVKMLWDLQTSPFELNYVPVQRGH